MAIVRKKRCQRCMEELELSDICISCDYDNTNMEQSYDVALPMGTLLADVRYLVGEAVHQNGQGFKYMGYDYENNIKVWIEEFIPSTLAKRLANEDEVVPYEGSETQFKTFQLDFSDINMTLLNMDNKKGLFPVIDCFEQNNTIYSVTQYIESITLGDLLKNNSTLNIKQTLAIFNPLLHTLSRLHNHNLIHRGLSLNTIYIDTNGDLRLSDFAVSSVRTANSELEAELFPGYTAPEQYDVREMQGTWTDVYSVSAVLYRALTGTEPVSANRRTRALKPISALISDLPDSVIYAVTNGLHMETDKRIKSMDTFIEFIHYGPEATNGAEMTKLVEVPHTGSITDIKSDKASSRRYNIHRNNPKERKTKKPASLMAISLIVTGVVGVIAVVVLILNINKIFGEPVRNSSSGSEISSNSDLDPNSGSSGGQGTEYIMTQFVGRYIDVVNNDKFFGKAFDVVIKYEFSEKYSENVVVSQSIEAGTKIDFSSGAEKMEIVVSKGKVELPEMENMPLETAESILEENGIEFTVREVYSQDVLEGSVVSIRRSSNNTVLMVSKGPREASSTSSSKPGSSSKDDDNYWSNW